VAESEKREKKKKRCWSAGAECVRGYAYGRPVYAASLAA
jgi:hypothetical protein